MKKRTIIAVAVFLVVVLVVAITVPVVIVVTSDKTSILLYDGTVKVKAKAVVKNDVEVFEYINIPYATAKRFEYPEVCSKANKCSEPKYDEVITCPQVNLTTGQAVGQEDCLVLTVKTFDKDGSSPVMVWVHGGGLFIGHGEEQVSPKSDFAISVHAVVVNINYRLGYLGFLSTPELKDKKLKTYGNYGHADQIAALQWIKNNIHLFGGDPNRVTLLGESAGATSLLALLTSPFANNMFRNIIALSPAFQWTVTNEELSTMPETTEVIKAIKCSNVADVAQCLKTAPLSRIVMANPIQGRGAGYFDFPRQQTVNIDNGYMTVVDGVIVEKAPIDYSSISFTPEKPINVFLSGTAQEISVDVDVSDLSILKSLLEEKLTKFEENTPAAVHFNGDTSQVVDDVVATYGIPTTGKTGAYYKKVYNTMATDIRSTCPANHFTNSIASNSNLNIYRMYITFSDSLDKSFVHAMDIYFGFMEHPELLGVEPITINFRIMIKDIVNESLNSQWQQFPSATLYLSEKSIEYKTEKPQEKECQKWNSYNMDYQYGWHN